MTVTEQESAATAPGQPLVVLSDVNKWYGELNVLKDIDLSVKKGEVIVVIGPSGAGKSTLCRAINRLETIDEGTITLDGQPLPAEGKALAALRAEVGMVFQSFNLFAHKTILENVTLGPIKVRKQKTAYAIMPSLVGSEMCIRDSSSASDCFSPRTLIGPRVTFSRIVLWAKTVSYTHLTLPTKA